MLQSKKVIGSIVLVCITLLAFPQEQLGLRLSNYSGINGTLFNPAFNVSSPLVWDVNLIAAGAFAENNYSYVKDASVIKIIRNHDGFAFSGDSNGEVNAPGRLQYDFTTGKRRKEAYANIFITGPSAMFHVKEHTLGVFFNFRSTVSVNRVPNSLGYYNVSALQTGDVLNVKPFKAAGLVWSEAGVNYGRNVYRKGHHTVNAGISLKFLQGYEAFYFQNHETVDIALNIDSMNYQQAHVTFGLASGALNATGEPYSLDQRGLGASLDMGAVYYRTKDKEKPFDWKIGVSLLDFGKITFDKEAQAHEINTDNAFDFVQGEYSNVQTTQDAIEILSEQSLTLSYASLVNNKFSIWTPAGISAFAEYAVTSRFYINAAVVRRLRFKGPVPERDNIWAVTPRYEHRWYEVSVPLVLYNDKKPRMGAAIRLGPLVIGSDNIFSWFGSHNTTGSDIYFALKLNPVSLHLMKQQRKSKYQPGKGFNVNDCFNF